MLVLLWPLLRFLLLYKPHIWCLFISLPKLGLLILNNIIIEEGSVGHMSWETQVSALNAIHVMFLLLFGEICFWESTLLSTFPNENAPVWWMISFPRKPVQVETYRITVTGEKMSPQFLSSLRKDFSYKIGAAKQVRIFIGRITKAPSGQWNKEGFSIEKQQETLGWAALAHGEVREKGALETG